MNTITRRRILLIKTHGPPLLWFDSLEMSTLNGQSKPNIIKLYAIALKGIIGRRIRDGNEVIFLCIQEIHGPKIRGMKDVDIKLCFIPKEKLKI